VPSALKSVKPARRFVVSGRVQGVGFRYYTREVAWQHGLIGRVRNRADGTVEVIASGAREQLDRFEDWLRHGPRLARVDALRVETIEALDYTDFDIDS